MKGAAVALCGYVTADIVAHAARTVHPTGTTPIDLPASRWPRAGGAPFFAGRALATAGHRPMPVSVIGDDASGAMIAASARRYGLSGDGMTILRGERTPACILIDQPDGGICCLLDTGNLEGRLLDAGQKALIARAPWVVIAAGPRSFTADILAHLSPEQKLAWIVKRDQGSFPQDLRTRLAARASVIFCNRGERDLVGATAPAPAADRTLFETDGERGVAIHAGPRTITLPTDLISGRDAVGAGDTFAGGALSVLVDDRGAIERAAHAGMRAAARLLEERLSSGKATG